MTLQNLFLASLILLYICLPIAHAEDLPLWELGPGITALSLPHYRGADQQKTYILPFPYFKYRGEYLKIDEKGGHLDIFESNKIKLDLSLGGAPPVDSDENDARNGMPDLDPSFEVGLQLRILLSKNQQNTTRWKIAFPLRSVYATDLKHIEQIGWVFAPHVQFEHDASWSTRLAFGPQFATQKYHNFYYQVDNAFANINRPAYTSTGGYSGSRITFTHSKRFPKFWVHAFVRHDNLSGAKFEDSPLTRKNSSTMAGVSIAWILLKSATSLPNR